MHGCCADGGGYAYRLCRRTSANNMDLDEKCFQQTHLDFVGSTQAVVGCTASNATHCTAPYRTEFPAMYTNKGTHPRGSMWARNPIPACKGTGGGAPAAGGQCDGPQFPPPAPGLYGFGNGPRGGFEFSVVDKLQVPHDLAPGEYVLSFRYDCERECSNDPWSALPCPRQSDRRSLCVARDEPGLERMRQRPHHRLSGLREAQRALGERGSECKRTFLKLALPFCC